MFEATIAVRPQSTLGAVTYPLDKWLVASADGAVWLTTVDPTAGVEQSGKVIPLNAAARTTSRFGSAVAPGGAETLGLTGDEPASRDAWRCALKSEKGE